MGRIDFGPLAEQYRTGRALPDWAVEEWRRVITEQVRLSPRPIDRVVDVGCGTGEWVTRLATWLDTSVVGVELSAEMIAFARERVAAEPVTVAQGRAEELPLRDASVAAAWVSHVLHHVDLRRMAAELRRVARPESPIIVRGYVNDLCTPDELARAVRDSALDGEHRTPGMVFPSVLDVLATFPSIDEVDGAFGSAGFERTHAAPVAQGIAADLQSFHDRLTLRADSTLQLISDDEFEAGLAALRREIADDPERAARPLIGPLVVIVYR